jgi:hypothetical protein
MAFRRARLIRALGTPESSDPKQAARNLLALVPLPCGGLTRRSTRLLDSHSVILLFLDLLEC